MSRRWSPNPRLQRTRSASPPSPLSRQPLGAKGLPRSVAIALAVLWAPGRLDASGYLLIPLVSSLAVQVVALLVIAILWRETVPMKFAMFVVFLISSLVGSIVMGPGAFRLIERAPFWGTVAITALPFGLTTAIYFLFRGPRQPHWHNEGNGA
jgi:hypothetical protein